MKLTFLDSNIIREISNDYIVRDSIKYEYQLLKDLSPSSNKVTFQITKDCPEIELIISAKKDVKVEGDFVGYLSNNYTWTITNTGEQALQLTVEDVGTRLLKKSFAKETFLKGRADSVLNSICALAGVERADGIQIDKQVCFISNGKYSDAIAQMLMECGYTYYFTNEGKLALKAFGFDADSSYTVDKTNLYSHSNNAITLTKKVKQYGLVDVSWKSLETIPDTYIYKDETGKDATHPYCYIPVKDFYPAEDDSYVKAVNLNDSREVAYIENIEPEVVYTGDITYDIQQYSPTSISVKVENKSNGTSHLTKLQCKADLTVYSSINSTIAGEADFETYKTEATWIHEKEDVESYANTLANYYRYCNQTYVFYSTEDMELGKVCNLKDETFSGLNVNVYLIGKRTNRGYFEYTAVATSNFDIDNATSEIITYPTIQPSQGPAGPAGPSGEDAKSFVVTISPDSFIRDLRREDEQTIYIEAQASGYEGEIGISANRGTLGTPIINDGYYYNTWKIPYNCAFDTAVITATLEGARTQVHTINVIDVTEYDKYFGKEKPTSGVLDGDSYFEGNLIYAYENGEWVMLSQSTLSDAKKSIICSKAQKDVLSVITPGSVIDSDFAYIMTIITNTITASEITMTDKGIIQSSGVNDSSVGADGYLTADGYRLEGSTSKGSGIMRAKNAYLDNISVKKGSLVDVSVTGELDGKYFSTIAKSDDTATVSIPKPTATHYSKERIRKDLREWLSRELVWANEYYTSSLTERKVESLAVDGNIGSRTNVKQVSFGVFHMATRPYTWFFGSSGDNRYLFIPENGAEGVFTGQDYEWCCLTGTGYSNEAIYLTDKHTRTIPDAPYTENAPTYGQVLVDSNSYLEYAIADQSFFNYFSNLTSGETYVTSGTATIDGIAFNGTFAVYYRPDSITFSQNGVSVTIDRDSYHVFGSDLNLTFTVNLTGIQALNIYPVSASSGSIGISSKRFKDVFSTNVDTGTVNASGDINSEGYIYGKKVYGAVFN